MATDYEDMDRLDQLVTRQGELLERFDQLDGYRVEADSAKVLAGLGFAPTDRDKLCEAFSGGWQMRIALAKMLVRKPDLLLLDEPTNHLDLKATGVAGGVPPRVPGHDRGRLARSVLHGPGRQPHHRDRGRPGGRLSWQLQLLPGGARAEAQGRRPTPTIASRSGSSARWRSSTRSARTPPARPWSRAASAPWRSSAPGAARASDPKITLRFAAGRPSPERVITVTDLAKAYDGRTVIDGLSIDLNRGDRVALVGPNGVGKSTLMRMIAGLEQPDAGTIELGQNVTVGYYAQDQAQTLDESRNGPRGDAGARPERLGRGAGPRAAGPLPVPRRRREQEHRHPLGGEKSRLSLAKLILQPRQLLLLDEPTNHLDVPSKDELEGALDNYPGAVIFASHDRFLLDRVATKVAELKDGKLEIYLGGWSRYREVQAEREEALSVA